MGAKAVHDVDGAAYCRGLPACGLSQLMHHEIWLPVGSQRSQVARSGDTGTAEEPHARLDHLPQLIHWRIIIGRRRLRSHLLRRRPY